MYKTLGDLPFEPEWVYALQKSQPAERTAIVSLRFPVPPFTQSFFLSEYRDDDLGDVVCTTLSAQRLHDWGNGDVTWFIHIRLGSRCYGKPVNQPPYVPPPQPYRMPFVLYRTL